jgi:hypothetical protein
MDHCCHNLEESKPVRDLNKKISRHPESAKNGCWLLGQCCSCYLHWLDLF